MKSIPKILNKTQLLFEFLTLLLSLSTLACTAQNATNNVSDTFIYTTKLIPLEIQQPTIVSIDTIKYDDPTNFRIVCRQNSIEVSFKGTKKNFGMLSNFEAYLSSSKTLIGESKIFVEAAKDEEYNVIEPVINALSKKGYNHFNLRIADAK